MLSVVLAVMVVSSVGAVLALLLVVSERFIADYGECKIDINGQRQLTVNGGKPLLGALVENEVFVPSACGGRGTCGYCKVKVLAGGGPVAPTETPFLSQQDLAGNVRLSCQVKIRGDIRIEIPEDLLAARRYEALCQEITELTYDIRRFRFKLTEPAEMEFVAGQYVQLFCPRYKGNRDEVYRAYSVASDPQQKGIIDLIIRRVPDGICTTYCFDYLKAGDGVTFNGPHGDFRLCQSDSPMIWIAGGSGMAPFVSMLHDMKNRGLNRNTTYFLGGKHVKDLFLLDQMKAFESESPGFRFVPVVAQPAEGEQWDGEKGLVTEAVERSADNIAACEAYLCGSPGMIDACIRVLTKLGVAEEKIFYDKFE